MWKSSRNNGIRRSSMPLCSRMVVIAYCDASSRRWELKWMPWWLHSCPTANSGWMPDHPLFSHIRILSSYRVVLAVEIDDPPLELGVSVPIIRSKYDVLFDERSGLVRVTRNELNVEHLVEIAQDVHLGFNGSEPTSFWLVPEFVGQENRIRRTRRGHSGCRWGGVVGRYGARGRKPARA